MKAPDAEAVVRFWLGDLLELSSAWRLTELAPSASEEVADLCELEGRPDGGAHRPAARRRERLEKRLREMELLQRGGANVPIAASPPTLDAEDLEDLEDAPDSEIETVEDEILDQATAARTIDELKAEIATLETLERLALSVRRSGEDRKWRELANLLAEIFTP